MTDSRAKGARGETVVRDELRKLTGLKWERVPGSGALHEKHGMKGDLYIPNVLTKYCVEVKNYEDDHLTSEVLTSKTPTLIQWWEQTVREAKQVNKKPLLIFKFNRSKIFVAFTEMPKTSYRVVHIEVDNHYFYVALLNDWITNDNPQFV